MAKKSGNFIEEHIEKLVLILVGLACIYPFYKYVLSSHDVIELNGRKFSPGQVDIHINEEADRLRQQLDREPSTRDYGEPCSPVFIAKLQGGDWPLDTDMRWPVPFSVAQKIERKYRIPEIGQVTDVEAEHIRAAAYVPKVPVTQENVNQAETYEPNDLDLVTVQGSIDVGAILDSFHECFAGKEVPAEWRDASLARPVFAAVQLQRQRLNGDGQWSAWEEVPCEKIDVQGEQLRVMEDVNSLPGGGAMILRLRLSSPEAQARLLQPEPYQIASAEEMWFPPVLHGKFLTIQRDKEAQERREAIAAGREGQTDERERVRTNERRTEERDRGRTEERDRSRTERDRTRTSRETPSYGSPGRGDAGRPGIGRSTTRIARPERDRRVEPTFEPLSRTVKPSEEAEMYDEFNKMLLRDKDVDTLHEEVTFWAHDDTVKPGNSYRYRIRVGVFNPVAGTGQVRSEYAAYENKVILWSDFSDVTEAIAIPLRVYFFPISVQEAAKAAEVLVCRYELGYWYSEQFMVKRGDVIGKTAKVTQSERKQKKEQDQMLMPDQVLMQDQEEEVKLPEMIDYTTGAVMVDLVAMNDWAGGKNLQQRQYFDMLYSFDGSSIERMAAKLMYWPDAVRAKYSEIRALEKKPKVAFREWSSGGAFSGYRLRAIPMMGPRGRGGEDQQRMMYDEMMRMRMGQPQGH